MLTMASQLAARVLHSIQVVTREYMWLLGCYVVVTMVS